MRGDDADDPIWHAKPRWPRHVALLLADEVAGRLPVTMGEALRPVAPATRPDTYAPADGLCEGGRDAIQRSRLAFADDARGVYCYHGDALNVMDAIAARHPGGCFDLIFADPPYFLSNGGVTCHSGRRVKVDKGAWDRSRGADENHAYNHEWLRRAQALLKPDGTLFVSGTHHVILSAGFAMQQLGMKLLNQITWQKPNPPPNLACRYFTHSTETILWAAKGPKSRHLFNYGAMRTENGGRQMKDVWSFTAPKRAEKRHGRHPTQKPIALLERIIRSATNPGDLVLDPFLGSGTTALACANLGRRCVGIEKDAEYVRIATARLAGEVLLFPQDAGGRQAS